MLLRQLLICPGVIVAAAAAVADPPAPVAGTRAQQRQRARDSGRPAAATTLLLACAEKVRKVHNHRLTRNRERIKHGEGIVIAIVR